MAVLVEGTEVITGIVVTASCGFLIVIIIESSSADHSKISRTQQPVGFLAIRGGRSALEGVRRLVALELGDFEAAELLLVGGGPLAVGALLLEEEGPGVA